MLTSNSAQNLNSILILTGPTAVGKTQLALEIADKRDGEIISADSRQVYRFLDIGTAKPSAEIRDRVPYYLIDILDPTERYSAARFRADALRLIREIAGRGRWPLVVGGTGLYLRALTQGLFQGPGADEKVRERLHKEALEKGTGFLHERLAKVDPKTAARLHQNDRTRIIRALEVYEVTGRPISEWQEKGQYPETEFSFVQVGLQMERSRLYERIDRRVDQMLANGLRREVEKILASGVSPESPGLKTVGYQEVIVHLAGRCSWDKTVALIKQHSRNFAKRQLTWFRSQTDIIWLDAEAPDAARRVLACVPK